jgi:hypothetical protein
LRIGYQVKENWCFTGMATRLTTESLTFGAVTVSTTTGIQFCMDDTILRDVKVVPEGTPILRTQRMFWVDEDIVAYVSEIKPKNGKEKVCLHPIQGTEV